MVLCGGMHCGVWPFLATKSGKITGPPLTGSTLTFTGTVVFFSTATSEKKCKNIKTCSAYITEGCSIDSYILKAKRMIKSKNNIGHKQNNQMKLIKKVKMTKRTQTSTETQKYVRFSTFAAKIGISVFVFWLLSQVIIKVK